MLVDENVQEEELQQTTDSEKVNTACPEVSDKEKIPPWRLERKLRIQTFLPRRWKWSRMQDEKE